MQAAKTFSAPGTGAPAVAARQPARPARLARRARHVAAPVAALDPSAVDALYQVQEFGLAVMGIGLVSTFAAGTARIMSRAAGAYTATAAATVLEQAAAPAAPVAVAPSCDLPARAAEQPAVPAQASLGLGDLSELREAAAAAVAAVASTAAVSTTAAVSSEPAPAKAAAPAANGAAVKPGMTVEEATQQVKDWIAAWRGEGEGEGAPQALQAGGDASTTRVTEPSMPASAAAVLSAMTADAPVGATPVGSDAPVARAGPSVEELLLEAVASAAPAAAPTGEGEAEAAAEREREYKAKISAVMADSKLAYTAQLQQQQARAERVAEQMRKRVVQVGVNYQSKIESLWQSYETKKAREAELLAKSERILQSLAESEALERQAQAAAEAELASRRQAREEQGAFAAVVARVVAFFQAIQRWFQQLVAFLTGSGSGAAGAST